MTPKEKALELVEKFKNYCDVDDPNGILDWKECLKYNAKQCALIAVDEIINSSPSLPILGKGGYFSEDIELSKYYWQEVKNEIKLL